MTDSTDYTTLTLPEVAKGLEAASTEVAATFGDLDAGRLNWRPDAKRWSVGQCLDHLLTANRLMLRAAEEGLADGAPRSLWQRVPMLPALFGRMLIRSQSPGTTRKFTAPAQAHPATSEIAPDVIQRFVVQHRDAVARLRSLDERRAAVAIMTSPFIKVVTYSVLDGWRLMLAHDRRHLAQATAVIRAMRETVGEPSHRQS